MDVRGDNPPSEWPGLVERRARTVGSWPDEVAIVLIHGAMDRGAGMAHLARRLGDAATVRYDRRGYGRAARLGVGGLVRQVDDLIEIVGRRRVVLFGHSFGGLIALGAAATGRLDVAGLVTWEVPTPWLVDWPGWTPADPGDVADRAGAIVERFMVDAIGQDHWRSLPEATRAARRGEAPALLADLDPLLRAGVPFDPHRIDVPCVFGAGERPGSPYSVGARWLADHIRGSRVELRPDASHGAPMSDPDRVTDLIRSVFDEPDEGSERAQVGDALAV